MKGPRRLLPVLFLLLPAAAAAEKVVIYHTSDVHGWYSARPAEWDNENPSRLIGGFAALSALVRQEDHPVLLLDSGDMSQGTPEGILTRGLASVELMNELGYAATVPGNHEYDYGEGPLKVFASSASFPVLGANIRLKETGAVPPHLKPYTIVERGGKRIAVLGLAGRHTGTSTLPQNVAHLDFRDEAAEAAGWLGEIRRSSPSAVVMLIHLGLDERLSLRRVDISTWTFDEAPPGTLRVARAAPGFDLVLGGHNHTALLKGYRDPVTGTVFGESGYGLSYTTRAELDFDERTGELKSVDAALVPLWTDETGEDPAVLEMIAGFRADVESRMGRVLGRAADDLTQDPGWLDSPIGNVLCDLTRAATGADIALHNTKAIRAPIRKGEVRLRDLHQSLPFENTIITMRLYGSDLRRIMADNIIHGRSFMQVSGMEVEFRAGDGAGPAVLRLLRGGREIADGDDFLVATNSYLSGGGDHAGGFSAGRDVRDTMKPVRGVIEDALARGQLKAPAGGRIRRLK